MLKFFVILSLFVTFGCMTSLPMEERKDLEPKREKAEEYIKDVMDTMEPLKPLLEQSQSDSDDGAKSFMDAVSQGLVRADVERPSLDKEFVKSYIKQALAALEPLKPILEQKDPGSFQTENKYGPRSLIDYITQNFVRDQSTFPDKEYVQSYINQAMGAIEPLMPLIEQMKFGSSKTGDDNGLNNLVDTISQSFTQGAGAPSIDKDFTQTYIKMAMDALQPLKPILDQNCAKTPQMAD